MIQLREAQARLLDLNRRFQIDGLGIPTLASQLKDAGFDPKTTTLVSIVPEGSGTYTVTLILQDLRVFEIDLDTGDPTQTTLVEVTSQFVKQAASLKRHHPWAIEVLSLRLHRSILSGSSLEEETIFE